MCFCPWGGDVHLGVVGEAVVVKFKTVEDSVDVFSVRDELLAEYLLLRSLNIYLLCTSAIVVVSVMECLCQMYKRFSLVITSIPVLLACCWIWVFPVPSLMVPGRTISMV